MKNNIKRFKFLCVEATRKGYDYTKGKRKWGFISESNTMMLCVKPRTFPCALKYPIPFVDLYYSIIECLHEVGEKVLSSSYESME